MEIFGFIPARGGSKGIPKKNIYPVNGKPLIAYTIEEARKSRINRVFVSTDSEEIQDVARAHGAEVPFLRSSELSKDTAIIPDALREVLDRLQVEEDYQPDVICMLHPTTPLRTAVHIDESIALLERKNPDAVIGVSTPMEHPAEMVYWDNEGRMRFVMEAAIQAGKTQRQAYPPCYFLNGAIYSFWRRSFMKHGSWVEGRIEPYFMAQRDSIDIDSLDDLLIAELLLKAKQIEVEK